MPIKPLSIYTKYYTSDYYSLFLKRSKRQTKIIMKVQQQIVNTNKIPLTRSILKHTLPTVLHSICYNENNYPFYKEVRHTEVGHLFEHIIIEYMCLLKVSAGFDDAEYTGTTKWNWKRFPKGSFHITVSAGINDTQILAEAMKKSIALINLILTSVNHTPAVIDTFMVQYIESVATDRLPQSLPFFS